MRLVSFPALLFVVSLACAQNTSERVTYFTRAARASVVIQAISKVTHVSLETSPQTQNEILVISVKDRPLSEVMARIATVTSGMWKQEGLTYRLIADAKTRKHEEQAELAKRIAAVQKSIKEYEVKAIKRLGVLNQTLAKKGSAAAGTTEEQITRLRIACTNQFFMLSLIKGLDASALAELGDEDRFVFSSAPTRMQRNFGSGSVDLINSYIQAHNEQIGKLPTSNQVETTGMDQDLIRYNEKQWRIRNAKIGQVSKASLAVSRRGNDDAAMIFRLRMYDASGEVLSTLSAVLEPGTATVPSPGPATTDTTPKPATSSKRTPIVYSEDSEAIMREIKSDISSGTLGIKPALRQKLFAPYQFDPLSFVHTDQLLCLAKTKEKSLIADIPDDMTGELFNSDRVSAIEEFEQAVKDAGTLAFEADSTYLMIKPQQPARSRRNRTDRLALTNLMKEVSDKGIPSLDDFATYVRNAPYHSPSSIDHGYFYYLVPGAAGDNQFEPANWGMLRLYGQLSIEQRTELANGGRILFSHLTAAQRDELTALTFGLKARLLADDPRLAAADTLTAYMPTQLPYLDYRDEPTEILPDGLPDDCTMEMRVRNDFFASPLPSVGSTFEAMFAVLGPEDFAASRMSSESKDSEDAGTKLPPMNNLKLGDRASLTFTFHVAPRFVIKQTLRDYHFPKNAMIVNEKNLPAKFQAQIALRIELAKQALAKAGAQFGDDTKINP